MKNMNQVIDIVSQSQHHMPALLSLLVGFIAIRRNPSIFFSDGEVVGDNIPITLMESIRR